MTDQKLALVVEDNPDNLKLMRWILEDEGFHITECTTAESGLEYLETHDVDIVLMDISLPNMDGKEATRRIRATQRNADLPIIAVTAHAVQGEMEAISASGVTDIVTKPIEEDSFVKTLHKLLGDG